MKRTRPIKFTRRAIPEGFSIALPRQGCPNCGLLIDVRIRKDGMVFFMHTGKFRRGGTKGGYSDAEESGKG